MGQQYVSNARTQPSMSYSVRAAFGVGDFGFLLVWQGTALFLLFFYTDVLGISPALAGAIYLAAMVWDAVTDPIIATFAERTNTRLGKYRPWLLFGALPFALSYPLAFSSPPAFWSFGIAAWALVTHLFLRTAYTIVSMPFNALQARVTRDAHERAIISGYRMIGSGLGGMAIAFLTSRIVAQFGTDQAACAYFFAACIAGGFTFLTILFCFFAMKEPDDASRQAQTSFWSDLIRIGSMLKLNTPLARLFVIATFGTVAVNMFGQALIYYFKYDLQRENLTTFGLTLSSVTFMIAVPFWVWLSGRTSKRNSMILGMMVGFVSYVLFFANWQNNFVVALLAIAATGVSTAAFASMFWSMLPDTVENGEALTGERLEAPTFGFATFAQKTAGGIGAWLFGWLIGIVGFDANAVQSQETLLGMKAIMALTPATGCLLVIVIMRRYPIDREMHQSLLETIQNHRNQDKQTDSGNLQRNVPARPV